jgi:hypothetical protein
MAETATEPEDDRMRDRFADFERAVLQDNIILCDQKSGILLAFAAALILICLEGFKSADVHAAAGFAARAAQGLLGLAGLAFLVCSYFALTTVTPRIRRGRDDHIFWESPVFKLPVEDYVARFRVMDVAAERDNRTRYLHMLAAICRTKYRHFAVALRFGQAGFIALVLAELIHAFA